MKGYVDLQVNGFGGVDFSSPGLTLDKIASVADALSERGTQMFCPTLITSHPDIYRSNLPVLSRAMTDSTLAPRLAGIHLEGPFLAPESAGAHSVEYLRGPDPDLFKRWQEMADGAIRILTLAPELPKSQDVIKEVQRSGVLVALGHHMAGRDCILRAVENGARLATHLGNGIANSLPRHPNPLWSQLACDGLSASFITDGHHLPAEFIDVAWRAKGACRFLLTSDAAPLAGCKPGLYNLWNREIKVNDDGKISLPDGSVLAGSSSTMDDCVRHVKSCLNLTDEEIDRIARQNALELLDHHCAG